MIVLNGTRTELAAGEGLAQALARLGVDRDARGVAVAVDGEVVPRSQWERLALRDGASVEVLSAMQGG
jgi:sulfur carrier protein